MDLAPAPMMLTVTGKRTRQGVVNIYQSYTAKDCCCTLVCNSGPQLAIRVEVFGRRDTAFVNFRLKANSKITIKGGLGNPYPYCIKWKLAEMKSKLEVHKRSHF